LRKLTDSQGTAGSLGDTAGNLEGIVNSPGDRLVRGRQQLIRDSQLVVRGRRNLVGTEPLATSWVGPWVRPLELPS
jgi:hypothetical protein